VADGRAFALLPTEQETIPNRTGCHDCNSPALERLTTSFLAEYATA
jgi:hypothetical protein